MGSTRLPQKVLLPILSQPMLWWDIHRVQKCRMVDEIVVATTDKPQDDPIVELCQQSDWHYYRGSEDDVLDRYYQTAMQFEADHIVRITSDCPLIDPHVTDGVIAAYHSVAPAVDYVSNIIERSYPRGLDTEVLSFASLETAWHEDQSSWREHVTPYIHQQPEKFRLHSITNPTNFSHHRWTVDTPQDMDLIRRIYDRFGHGDFHWRDVIQLLTQYPEWLDINRNIEQKPLS